MWPEGHYCNINQEKKRPGSVRQGPVSRREEVWKAAHYAVSSAGENRGSLLTEVWLHPPVCGIRIQQTVSRRMERNK